MFETLAFYFGRRALKAVVSGAGGAVLNSGLPGVFLDGVVSGVEPQVSAAGMVVGGLLGGGIQYLLAYIPRNK